MLQARLLGQCSLSYNGQIVLPSAFKRGSLTLLLWLLISPGHRLARPKVLDTLWAGGGNPEESYKKARNAIRQGLGASAEDPPCIVSDGQEIRLNPAITLDLDVEAFRTLARTALADADPGALAQAVALYAGPLLPGHRDESWTAEPRQALTRLHVRVLRAQADLYLKANDPRAEQPLRALLALDPAAEVSALALLRLLMTLGRWDEALRLAERASAAIKSRGRVPSEQFAAQHRRLLQRQPATNLPQPVGGFVGRDWDVAWLTSSLERPDAEGGQRLVTLTGSGGCGKTQLALKTANSLRGVYSDGVWWADLSAVFQPESVPRHLAALWLLREELGRPLLETLAEYLETKHLLLVLDNCEHLQAACAKVCATLLARCPHVCILATSRGSLGVDGEVMHRVPSLTLPPADPLPAPDDLVTFEAVRLFVQRAGVPLGRDNAATIAAICRLLDGMPLALVLAAARLRSMSAQDLLAGLTASLSLLAGPSTAPERQRTMRATLDWSYALLDEPEQRLLRRLSVFRGGWTLDGARAVWALEGTEAADAVATLDLLDRLVDKSLVLFEAGTSGAEPRYRLLEVVRQYARHRLTAQGAVVAMPAADKGNTEEAVLDAAHATYFLGLAQAAEPHLRGPDQVMWLSRLEHEHDNLRAALAWAARGGQAGGQRRALGLRLAGSLEQFWFVRGHLREGSIWLDTLLDTMPAPSADGVAARATALRAAGLLTWGQGDTARATERYEESRALFREVGDTRGIASVLDKMGNVANMQGDYASAAVLYKESLTLSRELGDKQGVASVLNNLGAVAWSQGDLAHATELLEESLALYREVGTKQGNAHTLVNLGLVAWSQGNSTRACALLEEGLVLFRELGNKQFIANTLVNLGWVAWGQGDRVQAHSLWEEGLILFRELKDKRGTATVLLNLGAVARTQGKHAHARGLYAESLALYREVGDMYGLANWLEELALAVHAQQDGPDGYRRAAQVFGSTVALRRAIGADLAPSERADYDSAVATSRASLGDTAFAAAWAEGEALAVEQACDLALSWLSPSMPTRGLHVR
jgi:predicted ATPase/DNA-binding SARP family transcriptional activator